MGYPLVDPVVRDAGLLPVSGAACGSVRLYDLSVEKVFHTPEEAMDILSRAIRISPAFVMAHVAAAHIRLRDEPSIGCALLHILAPLNRTEREESHLSILAAAGAGQLRLAMTTRHLDRWPTDRLAHHLVVQYGMDARSAAEIALERPISPTDCPDV